MNQKHNVYFSLDPIPNGLSKDGRSLGYKARMHPRETLDLRTILENDDQCRRVGPDMLAHHLEMALNAVKREALRSGSICRVGDFFTAEVNVTGRFVLVSRAGNPNAVSREVVRLWPIVAS